MKLGVMVKEKGVMGLGVIPPLPRWMVGSAEEQRT